ncbi:MAG: aminotransferase class I/II-fold pyridoxal phosphate-dependent enzyme [Tepidisphaera sp.]|nr:aminotransferase class I/II-fold pyridoxal phosphate-dependent enzyme [Tepidisphaera sp.]
MSFAPRVERVRPSLTLQINAEAAAMERGHENVARLGAGEPDFDTPEHIRQAAHQAIEAGYTRYTAVDGYPDLRAAVREKFARDNDLQFADEEVMVTCGAKQALSDLAQVLLRSGDEAVIPRPYWVSYPAQVTLAEADPVFVDAPMDEDFTIAPERLDAALGERTRLLYLNSPNNPTGRVYRRAELEAIAEVLRRHPRVWVVSDDIYEHIRFDSGPFLNLLSVAPDLADRTLVVNGVSKAYAMTGWRVGFVGGPRQVISEMTKVQGQSTAGTASISQHAAQAALRGDQSVVDHMVAAFRTRHERIVPALDALPGIRCRPSDGTFYAFPDASGLIERLPDVDDDRELAERLLHDAEVAVVPGSGFGMPGHLRVSFAASMDTIDTALERLSEFIERETSDAGTQTR